MKDKIRLYVGIDPGVDTGIALWDRDEKRLVKVFSSTILGAMQYLEGMYSTRGVIVVIEDPNKRKWFGNSGREKLQGAGSIKRDFSIWKEFLETHKFNYIEVAPKDVMTKLNQEQFRKITGWTKVTNKHSRDAGMMVFGR